jgi:hypothetical protein
MQPEAPKPEHATKKKGGRPVGYSPKAEPKAGISVTVEGDEVIIRIPKKELSRKLLADLI